MRGSSCWPTSATTYLGSVPVEHLLQVLVHLLVVHLQLHALPLKLPPHLVYLGRVLLHLLWVNNLLPLRVFSGSFGFGGSDPIQSSIYKF